MQFNSRKFATIRKRNKITQVEVAQKIGCTQSTVQSWESGKISPKRIDLGVIADALGCAVANLIDDYMPLPPASRYAALADDHMLPMLLDYWLQVDVVERAQIITYARSIANMGKENSTPPQGKVAPKRSPNKSGKQKRS